MAMTFRTAAGRMLALAAIASLGACSTTDAGGGQPSRGTSVTRFHLGGDFARGGVLVQPRFETQAAGGVYQQAFADSVERELRKIGFTAAPDPVASEFVATVDVAAGTSAALIARAPDATPGAETLLAADAAATQLAVQIKRRSDGSIVWQGRAQAPAGAGGVSTATVRRLAEALFRDFPGESARTINVR